MDRHSYLLKMFSGCQFTKDIAALYFPQFKCLNPRLDAFHQLIADTPGMYARLKERGFQDNSKFLTPQHLRIIVEFWGWPDAVEQMFIAAEQGKREGKN